MGTWEGEQKGGIVPYFAVELISKAVILVGALKSEWVYECRTSVCMIHSIYIQCSTYRDTRSTDNNCTGVSRRLLGRVKRRTWKEIIAQADGKRKGTRIKQVHFYSIWSYLFSTLVPCFVKQLPPKQTKNFFVTLYHYLLNEIWFFACMGHFWKIPCLSKTSLLPICLLCACKGREGVFPFFLRLAALCMVLLRRFKILLGRWISGKNSYKKKPPITHEECQGFR